MAEDLDLNDLTHHYNTELSADEQSAFDSHVLGDKTQRYDYDMQGFFKDRGGFGDPQPGEHFPDTYKKPNHPTFSNESKYHGLPQGDLPVKGGKTFEGGNWDLLEDNTFAFTPGHTNLERHSTQDLIDYFDKYEPKHKLVLPGY